MIPRIQLPQPVQPRHLYRHLLREASYLPHICRHFVDSSIRSRFEAVKISLNKLRRKHSDGPDPSVPSPDDRQQKTLREGLKQLRALRAINLGDDKRMARLLRHVFGRQGRRRRALVSGFLKESAPMNSAELQARLEKVDETASKAPSPVKGHPLKRKAHDNWDTDRLGAYLKSQVKQQQDFSNAWPSGVQLTSAAPRSLTSNVPKQDIWGNPAPLRKIRNMEERFWKIAADKTAPPVSKTEWDGLAAAAQGRLPEGIYTFHPRRTIARGTNTGDVAQEPAKWDWATHASKPAFVAESRVSWRNWRLTAQQDEGPYVPRPQLDTAISARRMRRELGHIWKATSYIQEDGTGQRRPSIHWGGNRQAALPTASAQQARLFALGEQHSKKPARGDKTTS